MTSHRKLRRARTHDVAFTFRMGAGFAGEINRTHPFSVVPSRQDATNPVARYGNAVLYDGTNNSARGMVAADTGVTKIAGVLVRPFPTQQHSASGLFAPAGFGPATPPTSGIIDALEDGFILVPVVGTPTKGGAVYVWVAASSGSHVQGGFETAASAGNTAAISNAYFTGGVDANGIAELQVFRA